MSLFQTDFLRDSTAVITQVAACDDAVLAFRKVSGLGVLTDLLNLSTASFIRTKENALSALLNLVRYDGKDAVADVSYSGSSKGRSKAVKLLRLLLR
ncbi:hypothetical protein Fmac_032708 [Flemingia macrophylla]|uniref:Uncharacterized protein n=1 Tax=Flemingia macrophylla TaxID=520843 RepID=A0ABD1L5N8_9FABA